MSRQRLDIVVRKKQDQQDAMQVVRNRLDRQINIEE